MEVLGSVLHKGLVLKCGVVGELVNLGGAATVAEASSLADYDMQSRETDEVGCL